MSYKWALFSVVMLSPFSTAFGDEEDKPSYRLWTDEESKRTIEGYITDKHRDGTSVEIRKKEGGHIWIPIAMLIKKDQEYAQKWVKAANSISVTNKVIKNGGYRVIRVRALAGLKDMSVKVQLGENGKIVTKKVKSGKTLDFQIEVYKGFSVSGYHGKKLIDRETALKKTGLQEN